MEDGSWGIVCETHQPEVWQRLRSEFQEEVTSRLKDLVEEREKWEDKWWMDEEVVEEGTSLEFETQPYVWEWDYFFPDEPCPMDEFGIPPWKPVEEDPPPSPPPRQPSLPLSTPEPPKIDDDDEEDWQDAQGWAWLEGEEDKGDEDWHERLQELFASLPTIAAAAAEEEMDAGCDDGEEEEEYVLMGGGRKRKRGAPPDDQLMATMPGRESDTFELVNVVTRKNKKFRAQLKEFRFNVRNESMFETDIARAVR